MTDTFDEQTIRRLYLNHYCRSYIMASTGTGGWPNSSGTEVLADTFGVEDAKHAGADGIETLAEFRTRLLEHLDPEADDGATYALSGHDVARIVEALEGMHGEMDPLRLRLLEGLPPEDEPEG